MQQLDADVLLKTLDLLRERRLRHVQPGRGPAEAELLGDRDESLQTAQFHALRPSTSAGSRFVPTRRDYVAPANKSMANNVLVASHTQ
nr:MULTISPECIES: hypothetical protein [unclassified Streptomyces]